MVSAGCGREGPVQPGSGWGLGDLCSDSRPSWAGGPTPCPGGLSSSTLPSDRCRRETAIPASSVLRSCCSGAGLALCPRTLFSSVWDRRRSQHPGPQVSLSPGPLGSPRRRPLLEALSRLGVRGQPDLWAPCVCQGGAGGQLGVLSNMPQVLPARVWACRPGGAGAVMLGQSSKPCSFCPAVSGPWLWGSPPAPGEDTAGTPGRGSGPTKSHMREPGGRPPSPVQRSLQRTSPGQNCDHSV